MLVLWVIFAQDIYTEEAPRYGKPLSVTYLTVFYLQIRATELGCHRPPEPIVETRHHKPTKGPITQIPNPREIMLSWVGAKPAFLDHQLHLYEVVGTISLHVMALSTNPLLPITFPKTKLP